MTRLTHFETLHAERYLDQLCKHFSRKVDVDATAQEGWVTFPFGRCRMTAKAHQLEMQATAGDAEGLEMIVQIMTSHLERYAFRENPNLTWQNVPD